MKKVLGFACSIALICFVMGCGGDDKSPAKTEPAKTTGTSQTDNKDPKQSADSQPAPKQNEEPGDIKVQTPAGDVKVDSKEGDVKVDTPEAKIEVENKAPENEAPAPEKAEKAEDAPKNE
jgi:hypothetical protein